MVYGMAIVSFRRLERDFILFDILTGEEIILPDGHVANSIHNGMVLVQGGFIDAASGKIIIPHGEYQRIYRCVWRHDYSKFPWCCRSKQYSYKHYNRRRNTSARHVIFGTCYL